jgi:predicted DsbA family dithiol-disulfide isomerase
MASIDPTDLKRYAVELGLDSNRFAHDRTSPEAESRIDRDLASGEKSGVQGTPTFYVNGVRHDGGYNLESLRSAILAHIEGRARAHAGHA